MYTEKTSLIFSLILLLFLLQTASAELTLPAKVKQVTTTAAGKLGSHENNLGLKTGAHVPEFESHTYTGESVTLADLLKKGTLMVIFYRGGWCPYCNYQVRQITRAYTEFQQRHVTPVLISVDKTEGAALLQQSYDIPFPVLSDPELAAHQSFNTLIQVDDALYEKYKNLVFTWRHGPGRATIK